MNYLTPEQVLFIHARLIAETGGTPGIRDIGSLLSAIARPQATFEGESLYPDIFQKAAALFQSIIFNHPFLDGNKRTGITAAFLFLQLNGYKLAATQKELYTFTHSIVGGVDIPYIAAWFSTHIDAV